jgi:hypothetical protein
MTAAVVAAALVLQQRMETMVGIQMAVLEVHQVEVMEGTMVAHLQEILAKMELPPVLAVVVKE